MFNTGKVRGFLHCRECGKRRLYYSAHRLTRNQVISVDRVEEELFYTCGSSLFPEEPYKDQIVVKEALMCSSTMEVAYYAGRYSKESFFFKFYFTNISAAL